VDHLAKQSQSKAKNPLLFQLEEGFIEPKNICFERHLQKVNTLRLGEGGGHIDGIVTRRLLM
jgi:hypothetical protein